MGKDKRRKREIINELSDRLLELEKRMRRKHHEYSDDYKTHSNRSRSPRRRQRSTPREQRRMSVTPYSDEERNTESQHDERGGGGADDTDTDIVQQTPLEPPLPANIEELLGEEGAPLANNAINIHDGLARRWTTIIQDGLKEDIRKNIMKKYDTPKNIPLLIPPKLNEEVVAAMNDSGIKSDKRIVEQQAVLGAAVTCIGKVLNNIMSCGNEENIEILSDSGRLLCDLYHDKCLTRRSLILPGLNKDMKELMEETPISVYLFGDKLQDKVNAVKAVKKSGQELKNTPPQAKPPMKPTQKNFRGPQRPQVARSSGPKQTKKMKYAGKQTVRARRSPPKRYHSRRQDRR